MTRSVGLVLALLLVVPALSACGAAGGRGSATRTTATRPAATSTAPAPASASARARAALLRVADFPHGWAEQQGAVTRLRCGSLDPYAGSSALVSTRRLTFEHDGAQERVAVFPSAAAASRAMRRLNSRAAANCLRRELRRYVSRESGGPATPPALMRLDRIGPSAEVRRYLSRSISTFGQVVADIDALHVRDGKAIAVLVLVDGTGAPDEAFSERVVATVRRRLHSVLG